MAKDSTPNTADAAKAFQQKVDHVLERDRCPPGDAMMRAAAEFPAEFAAWKKAGSARHVVACSAPGAGNGVDKWVLVKGSPGAWSEPGTAIHRAGVVHDAIEGFIQGQFNHAVTITEETEFDGDPDATWEGTILTVCCPAIAGQRDQLWGFITLQRDGSFRAAPIVWSASELPGMLRELASTTWAKPTPPITRALQLRPAWGMNQFGWCVIAGKTAPLKASA